MHVSYRHKCSSQSSPCFCTRGNGKPRRKACKHCGASLYVESGVWAAIPWRGDGRYRVEDAVSTHRNEDAARRVVDADPGLALVVRFLSVA